MWIVDVHTASHESVMRGVLVERISRVLISEDQCSSPVDAEVLAGQFAVLMHGGMPTYIQHCV